LGFVVYRFALQPVLNHRKFIEEGLQKELSCLNESLADEKRKLQSLGKARIRFSEDLRNKTEENTNVSIIMLYVGFLERLLKDIEEQKKEILKAEEKAEKKRKEVVEAMKNRKSIEKLKEKKVREYTRVLLKKEQDFVNEISINRYNRGI